MALERSDVFWMRMAELNVTGLVPNVKARGLTSYMAFALGSGLISGTRCMGEGLSPALLSALSGDDDSWLPKLRQLWWESWTHCSQDIENRARAGVGGTARNVSRNELENMRATTLNRLTPGFKVGRSTDILDALLKALSLIHI